MRHSLISKILSRLTYANVMATVAVFVSLGGGAYAMTLAKNSVKSKHIAPSAVRSADIKNGAVRSVDVGSNSITGADVKESTLGTIPSAADAGTLDGQDSSAFLGVTGQAADANTLDGQDSGAFLGVTGKAADANTLDGQDSSAFLGSTAKAADAQLLDGVDSLDLPRFAGSISSTRNVSSGTGGFTVTKLPGLGTYFVSFPAGTFGPSSVGSCTTPIAVVTPTTGSLRFAAIAGSQCSSDGSGGFTVETYDDDAAFTLADTSFNFMAR